MEENMEAKILAFIDRIRPFLVSDGGNIEFVKWEDGIVYVKLLGACAGCSSRVSHLIKEKKFNFCLN